MWLYSKFKILANVPVTLFAVCENSGGLVKRSLGDMAKRMRTVSTIGYFEPNKTIQRFSNGVKLTNHNTN